MYRLNRGLELKPAGTGASGRFGKMAFSLLNEWQRPSLRILLRQRNEATIPSPAGRPPCFAVEHESQQSLDFCFSGHQLEKDASQPDRFLGKFPAALVSAGHVIPANPEGGIDRFQHGVEPLW